MSSKQLWLICPISTYDTIIWSVVCGLLAIILMFMASRKATAGVPSRFQCAIEMLVEMVDGQAKSIVHGNVSFIAPMALTVFMWVSLMNSMDFCQLICSQFGLFPLFGLDPDAPSRGANC